MRFARTLGSHSLIAPRSVLRVPTRSIVGWPDPILQPTWNGPLLDLRHTYSEGNEEIVTARLLWESKHSTELLLCKVGWYLGCCIDPRPIVLASVDGWVPLRVSCLWPILMEQSLYLSRNNQYRNFPTRVGNIVSGDRLDLYQENLAIPV